MVQYVLGMYPAPVPPGIPNSPDTVFNVPESIVLYNNNSNLDVYNSDLQSSGGYPLEAEAPRTYSILSNGGATSLSIVDNLRLHLGAALSAGTYVVTIQSTHADQTSGPFTVTLEVQVALSSDFPTPDWENDVNFAGLWDSATVTGTQGSLTVTSVDRPSLNGAYTSLNNLAIAACNTGGNVKFYLPAGDFDESISVTGNNKLMLIGPTTEPTQWFIKGKPLTTIRFFGITGGSFNSPPAEWILKNIAAGPPATEVEENSVGTQTLKRVLQSWTQATLTSVTITVSGITATHTFGVGVDLVALGIAVDDQIHYTGLNGANIAQNARGVVKTVSGNVLTTEAAPYFINFVANTIDTAFTLQKIDPRWMGFKRGPKAIRGGGLSGGNSNLGTVSYKLDNVFVRSNSGDGGLEYSPLPGIPFNKRVAKVEAYDSCFAFNGGDPQKHNVYQKQNSFFGVRNVFVAPVNGGHTYKSEAWKDVAIDSVMAIQDGSDRSICLPQTVPAGSGATLTLNGYESVDGGGTAVFREEKYISVTWVFNAYDREVTVNGKDAVGNVISDTMVGDGLSSAGTQTIMSIKFKEVTSITVTSGAVGGQIMVGDGVADLIDGTACIDGHAHSDWRFSRTLITDRRRVGGSISKPRHRRFYFNCQGKTPPFTDMNGGLMPSDGYSTVSNVNGASTTMFHAYILRAGTNPPPTDDANIFTLTGGLQWFPAGNTTTATLGVDYDVKIWRTDGSIKTSVGKFLSQTSFQLNNGDTIGAPGTPLNSDGRGFCFFKLATTPDWDSLRPNEEFYNPAHPNYWPDRILTVTKTLDVENKFANIPTAIFDECLFEAGRINASTTFILGGESNQLEVFTDGFANAPKPPCKDPLGRWADPVGGGDFNVMSHTGNTTLGTDPVDPDWPDTTPYSIIWVDSAVCKSGTSPVLHFGQMTSGGLGYLMEWQCPDIRWVSPATGTLSKAVPGQTTGLEYRDGSCITVGVHAAGATDIAVSSVPTGTTVGDKVLIGLYTGYGPGYAHGRANLHVTSVDQVLDSTHIRIVDPLPIEVYKRAPIGITEPAASRPAFLPTRAQFPVS